MNKFLTQLKAYHPSYEEEVSFKVRMVNLIETKKDKAFLRSLKTGHFTASAWVLSEDKTKALLLHHKKLNRWLQPGGHADGIMDLEQVAFKEVEEETGLKKLSLISNEIFDIDIHAIPVKGDIEAHFHYDVRYLFKASKDEMVLINEESNAFKWVALEDLLQQTKNQSIIRMVKKSLNL